MHRRFRSARTAFTLTEIMFAVIILGIGFILVAAMFPVAIQQSRLTAEETAAAAIARGAVGVLGQMGSDIVPVPAGTMRQTGNVVFSFYDSRISATERNDIWNTIKGNLINVADPRYAWVPLYRREPGSNAAQVFVIVTQIRNRPVYEAADLNASLQPVLAGITIAGNVLTFTTPQPRAAENAFVVISDDGGAAPSQNGTIVRLGNLLDPATNQWELAPGWNAVSNTTGTTTAFLIGRGLDAGGNADGPAQDVAIYTSFVTIR